MKESCCKEVFEEPDTVARVKLEEEDSGVDGFVEVGTEVYCEGVKRDDDVLWEDWKRAGEWSLLFAACVADGVFDGKVVGTLSFAFLADGAVGEE